MDYENRRFQSLIHDLENYLSKGTNSRPKTVLDAYSLLTKWKAERISNGCMLQEDGTGFHQQEEKRRKAGANQAVGGPKQSNRHHKDLTCHRCGQKGHITPNCLKKPKSDAHIHTQDGDESPAGDTDATEVSFMMEHMENKTAHSSAKEANQLLIKSIQENADTNDGAAYHILDFLGFNSYQNSVAYAREAFNLANVGIPNTWVLLISQSTVNTM